jgi:hypothetical protein
MKRPLSALRNLYTELLDDNDELITDLAQVKSIALGFLKNNINDPDDLKTMVKNVERIATINELYDYFCNSLLVFENRPYFYRIAGDKRQRFTNICTDGKSEWDR